MSPLHKEGNRPSEGADIPRSRSVGVWTPGSRLSGCDHREPKASPNTLCHGAAPAHTLPAASLHRMPLSGGKWELSKDRTPFYIFFFLLFFFLTGFTQKENQYSYRNTTGLTKPEEKTALEAAFSGEFGHRTTGPKRFSVSWARRMGGRRQRNQHFIHQDEFSPGKPGQPLSPSTLCQHHSQTLLPSVRATRITRVSRSP